MIDIFGNEQCKPLKKYGKLEAKFEAMEKTMREMGKQVREKPHYKNSFDASDARSEEADPSIMAALEEEFDAMHKAVKQEAVPVLGSSKPRMHAYSETSSLRLRGCRWSRRVRRASGHRYARPADAQTPR